jgi:putative membrane protein
MSHMVADHKKDVAEFQKESSAARDPEIKSFASQTLPTLQEHLKQAQSIAPAQ